MSYYSELAARIAEINKAVDREVAAKNAEIASLKEQLNTVLSSTVSLRSYENTLEELDASDALVESLRAEIEALKEKNSLLEDTLEDTLEWVEYWKGLTETARKSLARIKNKLEAVDAEKINLVNEAQREAARANEHAAKMEAAWRAASCEAEDYADELTAYKNHKSLIAAYDLSREDLELAKKLKTIFAQQVEIRRYPNDVVAVTFNMYPSISPTKENYLWKHLRSIL